MFKVLAILFLLSGCKNLQKDFIGNCETHKDVFTSRLSDYGKKKNDALLFDPTLLKEISNFNCVGFAKENHTNCESKTTSVTKDAAKVIYNQCMFKKLNEVYQEKIKKGVDEVSERKHKEIETKAEEELIQKLVKSEGFDKLSKSAQIEMGKKVFNSTCIMCHTLDGSKKVGGTLKGYWGSAIKNSDGTTSVGNEDHFKESLYFPNRKKTEGFENLMMNNYRDKIIGDDYFALIEFIKSKK